MYMQAPKETETTEEHITTTQLKQIEYEGSYGYIQPLQRREEAESIAKPSGSSAFVDLAQKMGEKYQVDTSPLQATHNSSFPEQVGAAATLQGAKVDFAPGQDTVHNMKHEIGHFVINTKRGTPPVADTTVNGHAVNTTDEAAADAIADAGV